MTVRLEDPEARLQHARDVAWKALNRRERTVAELARLLAAKRVEPAAIEAVLAELLEQGYLDDASYAQRFADDRRQAGRVGRRADRAQAALARDRSRPDRGRDRRAGPGGGDRGGAGAPRPPLPGSAADAARARSRARHARPQGLRARARLRRAAPPRGRARRVLRLDRDRPGYAGRRRLRRVCAGGLAVLRSGKATDRAVRGPKRPANHHFLQAEPADSDVTAIHDTTFERATLESQAGGPGHSYPTAHLAAI